MYLNPRNAYSNKVCELANTQATYFTVEEGELKPGKEGFSRFADTAYMFPMRESTMAGHIVRLVMEGSQRGFLEDKTTRVALSKLFTKLEKCGYFVAPQTVDEKFVDESVDESPVRSQQPTEPFIIVQQQSAQRPQPQPLPSVFIAPPMNDNRSKVQGICDQVRKELKRGNFEECQILLLEAFEFEPNNAEAKQLKFKVLVSFAEKMASLGDIEDAYSIMEEAIIYGREIPADIVKRLADIVIKYGNVDGHRGLVDWLISVTDAINDLGRKDKLRRL